MRRSEFRDLLESSRPQAVRMLMKRKVQQWMEDGQAGVVEAVARMIDERLDLGDNDVLISLAAAVDLVEE